jgi:aspartate-semialdehyde dehydrogenase
VNKIPVGVLGATGAVGQKFVTLLADHPWFELRELAASDRSAGHRYGDIVSWKQAGSLPEAASALEVKTCKADMDCPIVFSGLDSSVAGEVETEFASRGHWVFSNAKNHRMDPDVPLLIPELNTSHLDIVPWQRKNRNWSGALVTNANCSSIVLALSLGPLHRRFGLELVQVVTFQAISGAGYPGVPSLDILGNVLPFISGEEDKIETETQKMLGALENDSFSFAQFTVSAQANRVSVEEGHLECVSLRLKTKASVEDVIAAWEEFKGPPQELNLPSAPRDPVVVFRDENRPQPRLDVWKYGGMSSLVGRTRPCSVLDIKYVVLGHNTIRGAAGASILNAELVREKGLLN